MAYITSEQVKQMRNEIKSIFPKGFKFSITRQHYSTVSVVLLESPLQFKFNEDRGMNRRVNHYYLNDLKRGSHKVIMMLIKSVVEQGNYNRSDSMTDYHEVGWYSNIEVGKWNQDYKQVNN